VLITWVPELAEATSQVLEAMVARHERADDIENALIEGGVAVLVKDLDHAFDTANAFAPEHLELLFEGAAEVLGRVRNAGSVSVGAYSPVSASDYVAGTNHILPTGGSARWASGLSAADFVTRTNVCSLERGSLERLAPHIDSLSEAEGLPAHARAVELRLAAHRRG
jgi:histidinol dehydrogenase